MDVSALPRTAATCPVGEEVSRRLISLSFHNHLTEQNRGRVVDTRRAFRFQASKPWREAKQMG